MTSRRKFIRSSIMAGVGIPLMPGLLSLAEDTIMTVNGAVRARDLKLVLVHEHVMVDFIGAAQVSRDRYNADEVFETALPFLKDVKSKGCHTLVECTPAYLGRDVALLKRLSAASGLQIITNTGYYGAVGEKHLPQHVYSETAEQLAVRWTKEWKEGIDGTGIKPGFIKTGVDKGPLTEAQRKIIDAAAITHLATGLTIGVHTGNGEAAKEQLEILKARGVSPTARIWIHAQNEEDIRYHLTAARAGSWISLDGVNPDSAATIIATLKTLRDNGLLSHVLLSQDSGWYHVGEPKGGSFNAYTYIFTHFIPALKQQGFTTAEIETLFVKNPAKALTIGVRRI